MPLECAGVALLLGSYVMEWTVRGYMDYQYLRTTNMHYIVPWYDALPQIGLVLFVTSWWSAADRTSVRYGGAAAPVALTLKGALMAVLLALLLIALNRPRVDALVRASVPALLPSERKRFPIVKLQTMRANAILYEQARWQRLYLRRLDRAEQVARRLGLSRDDIRRAFGHQWVPASGRGAPLQPNLYDAAALLDLPEHGRTLDAANVYHALKEYLVADPEPRPEWLEPDDPWPPP